MRKTVYYCSLIIVMILSSCNKSLCKLYQREVEDKLKFELIVNIYRKVQVIEINAMNYWSKEDSSDSDYLKHSVQRCRRALSVFDDEIDAVRSMKKEIGGLYYNAMKDYISTSSTCVFIEKILAYYEEMDLEFDSCVRVGNNRYKIHERKSNAVCFVSNVNGMNTIAIDLSQAKGKLDIPSDKIIFDY